MNIHTTLKSIRIEKGMTQEQVADKIGLTRQAISAYESGKRQPGLDILISLAEFYNVEIEEILYGTKKQNNNRIIKIIAGVLAVLFIVLQSVTFMIRTTVQTKYPFTTGIVEYSQYDELERRNELYMISACTEGLSDTVLLCGSIILCVMDLCLKTTYSTKHKIVSVTGFFMLIVINHLFWSAFFPEWNTLSDFVRYSLRFYLYPVILFLLNIIIDVSIKLRRKHHNNT